jgi:Flp pilus assembly protein TadG
MIGAWRGRRSEAGQTLVEFTMVLPVFLLLLGIAEGGYYVVATTAVSHATHEGARMGILESTADTAAIQTRVQESASAVVGLSDAAITLQLNGSSCDDTCYTERGSGDRLNVDTAYVHRPLLGYIFGALEFPSGAKAELVVE